MTITTSARAPDLRGSLAMTHLHGRLVYTRGELQERTGLSQRAVEQLYYDRNTNGHPESTDKAGRAMVWDAADWDAWWTDYNDTTGLATLDTLAGTVNRSVSRLRDLWADRENNGHPEPRKYLQGTPWFDREEYLAWTPTTSTGTAARSDIDRSGDPDDLLTLSEVARVLRREPTSITKYTTRPPIGWPDPDPEGDELLPSGRIRKKWRRRRIWDFADTPPATGGRTPGPNIGTKNPGRPYRYHGDPRLDIARAAIVTTAPEEQSSLNLRLATEHPDTPPGTWSHILASARKHPSD